MENKRKGKHPEEVLSATQIRNLHAPGKYVDGNGLYLIVEPSGAKRWVLRTIIKGVRSVRLRRMADTAAHLVDRVIPEAPVRQ